MYHAFLNTSAIFGNFGIFHHPKSTFQVSFNDYQTYLTKEGELFDKSLTESFRKDGSDSTNIKRENKAYSYKEQVRM